MSDSTKGMAILKSSILIIVAWIIVVVISLVVYLRFSDNVSQRVFWTFMVLSSVVAFLAGVVQIASFFQKNGPEFTILADRDVIDPLIRSVKSDTSGIQFGRISLATDLCLWETVNRSGERFVAAFHQAAVFSWSEAKQQRDRRVADPIFDITILYLSEEPTLVTGIGFQAVNYWSVMKGLPVVGKVKVFETYKLKVDHFIPGGSGDKLTDAG